MNGSLIIYLIPFSFLVAYIYPYLPGHDLPWCAIKIGTGIDCPGCGMIRSVSALLHGNFAESIRFHPLGIEVALWFMSLWVYEFMGLLALKLTNSKTQAFRNSGRFFSKIFAVALFVVWITRLV